MTLCAEMKLILSRLFATAAMAIAIAAPLAPAQAEETVGVAVTVKNEVTGKLQSSVVRVDNGSNVYGREIVKTAADSSAKLVLKDNTNLNVGPNSSVSLDGFVFAGDSDYKQAGFNLAKGAFRFTSGASDKRAYDLKTPVATSGVRGTDFVVIVNNKKSHVEVSNGLTLICPANATSKEAVLLDLEKRKKCQKDEPNNRNCGCTRKCGEVGSGRAADVSDEYLCPSEYSGVQVGNDPMSFAEASAPAIGAPAIGIAAVIGGIVAGTVVGSQHPTPPITLPQPHSP
jgi:hypothetical protein